MSLRLLPCAWLTYLLIIIIFFGNIRSEFKSDDLDNNSEASKEIVRAKRFIHRHAHDNTDSEDYDNPFRRSITARRPQNVGYPIGYPFNGRPSIHDNTEPGSCVRPGGPCFRDLRCCTEKCQWVSFLFKCVYSRPGDTHVGGK